MEIITAKIRVMEPRDIPFAIRLTDTEGWGFTRQDFLRLLHLDPSGSFVAVNRNRKVGLINTTTYDRVAWIGNVIVAKSMRSQGVGNQLLKSAISHIEAKGIKKIGLYSYIETRSLYKKFGFVEKAHFLRYVGTAKARAEGGVEPYRSNRLNDIVKFDRGRFGADRRKLLTLLCNEFPNLCFISEDYGKVVGYVIAKGAQSGYEIGPWICDHIGSGSAEALLETELNQMKGKKVEITVPKRNRHVARVLRRLGFSLVGEVAEMFRGGYPTHRLDTIYAAGGLEKG